MCLKKIQHALISATLSMGNFSSDLTDTEVLSLAHSKEQNNMNYVGKGKLTFFRPLSQCKVKIKESDRFSATWQPKSS